MLTVNGEGRGFRVVWLLEEMGLPYRLRGVDLLAGVENDPELLKINPAGFIPALVDGEVTMVESIAILQYLMARHGPTDLAVAPEDPRYPLWLQFLLMGEAGLSMPMFYYTNALRLPTEADRTNPTARHTLWTFKSRLDLVRRQLGKAPYMAGEAFTAADISVVYALNQAGYGARFKFDEVVSDYLARVRARACYERALSVCEDTRAFYESVG
ncbi:glutathione S-transferase family protein [Pseudoroseicyclus sp. CXY001]|uniref:glutathione S-transferase family protein n=1 Tax=Pseudoroseicyclus sp. CXY001 TaxID=3242492 RepID=UPI003570C06B